MKIKFNISSILAQLLLLSFVIVWIAPTFGLFISLIIFTIKSLLTDIFLRLLILEDLFLVFIIKLIIIS